MRSSCRRSTPLYNRLVLLARNVYAVCMKKIRTRLTLPRLFLHALLALSLVLLAACGKSHTKTPYSCLTPRAGAAIASAARSQLGKPYVRGGISPQYGFDCSGLVYWAYASNGVNVPRMTSEQAKAGHPIERSALLPGDIVVFKTSWTGYHTGIYLGEGRFVHSPKPKTRVRIDSLQKEYWKDHYVTGRRVVLP